MFNYSFNVQTWRPDFNMHTTAYNILQMWTAFFFFLQESSLTAVCMFYTIPMWTCGVKGTSIIIISEMIWILKLPLHLTIGVLSFESFAQNCSVRWWCDSLPPDFSNKVEGFFPVRGAWRSLDSIWVAEHLRIQRNFIQKRLQAESLGGKKKNEHCHSESNELADGSRVYLL